MATILRNLPGLSAGERVTVLSTEHDDFTLIVDSNGDKRTVMNGDVDAHDYCEHDYDWCVA